MRCDILSIYQWRSFYRTNIQTKDKTWHCAAHFVSVFFLGFLRFMVSCISSSSLLFVRLASMEGGQKGRQCERSTEKEVNEWKERRIRWRGKKIPCTLNQFLEDMYSDKDKRIEELYNFSGGMGWGRSEIWYKDVPISDESYASFVCWATGFCEGPVAEFVSNVRPKGHGLVALQKKPQETVWLEEEEEDHNISWGGLAKQHCQRQHVRFPLWNGLLMGYEYSTHFNEWPNFTHCVLLSYKCTKK